MRLNSRKVWLQSVYATGLVTQDSRNSPGWCPRSFAQQPKRTARAVDSQAINSGAWQGFGMSGAGVRNTARLSRASESKLIDAQQICELLRKVRCWHNNAGRFNVVGNGQLAPAKIHISPFQCDRFFLPGTRQRQSAKVHAGGAVVQLLHTRAPVRHAANSSLQHIWPVPLALADGRGAEFVRQHLVNALTVQVDHLKLPAGAHHALRSFQQMA